MKSKHAWHYNKQSPQADDLALDLGVPMPVARLLVARGVDSVESALRFLNPDLKEHIGDPFDFPGAREAAGILRNSLQNQRKIVVFGDYDVDGIAATAIMVTALRRLGGRAEPFLPHRKSEGYGLTAAALQRCRRQLAPELLITVDCGINSPSEVAMLREQGVQTVIIDHHEPAGAPPQTTIVNPRTGCSKGAEHLCGAGVAFKVVHALVKLGREEGWYQNSNGVAGELLALAGLATVADIVPLVGENRLLVWSALKNWNSCANIGLQALLLRAAPTTVNQPDAHTMGFVLGPRINAAGRMDDAMAAYQLLTCCDKDQAAELATRLEGFNGQRHGIEKQMVQAARKQCGLDAELDTFSGAAVVAGGMQVDQWGVTGWHPGVIGIVAARLCDATGVPAAVLALNEAQGGRGSARANGSYNVLEAISAASAALEGFGGHAGAAGFNLKPGAFALFQHLFSQACAKQSQAGATGRILQIDGSLTPAELSLEFYEHVEKLAPFGHGNPVPRWEIKNLTLDSARMIGMDGAHLACTFKNGSQLLPRCVWFRHGQKLEEMRRHNGEFDIVCELRKNHFRAQTSLELQLVDMRGSPA